MAVCAIGCEEGAGQDKTAPWTLRSTCPIERGSVLGSYSQRRRAREMGAGRRAGERLTSTETAAKWEEDGSVRSNKE